MILPGSRYFKILVYFAAQTLNHKKREWSGEKNLDIIKNLFLEPFIYEDQSSHTGK